MKLEGEDKAKALANLARALDELTAFTAKAYPYMYKQQTDLVHEAAGTIAQLKTWAEKQ